MRIAVVSNTAWYLFNFRFNLMSALQSAGHTVVAVAPIDAYSGQLRAAGFVFEDVRISGSGTNPFRECKSVVAFWRLLHRQRIDLVVSFTPKGNLYSALACIARKVPFVPGVSGLGRAFIRRSLVTVVALILYRFTFRRAFSVFFENLDDKHLFERYGLVRSDNAIHVPGAGIDLVRFSPMTRPTPPVEPPVFLLVARILWDKGVGEFVVAARRVRSLHPQARFQLLGFLDDANPSAIPREQVNEWVAEGIVEYLGQTDDVRPYLSRSDCVVLPSYREGLPRTLLEAAAMGRPVITTDVPGCRDTVIEGETGYLCRPADAADLSEKLLRYCALTPEQRQAMGQRGREFVENNFDERLVISQYLKTIALLVASHVS